MNEFILQKEEKKCLISFTKLNRYYIIPFICPFLIYFRSSFLKLSKFNGSGLKATFQYEFNESLKYCVCGMLYFILYCTTKNKKEKEGLNDDINKKEKEHFENKKLKFYLLLSIMVLVYMVFIYNSEIFSKQFTSFEIRLYYLIFNTILCRIILKENFFSHHFLSLILAVIGWIFISIPIFAKITKKDLLLNFIILLFSTSYPLYLVFFKYIIEKYYISPFLVMLLFGIYLLVVSISGIAIYSLIKFHNLSQLGDIFNFSENNLYFFGAFCVGTIAKVLFCVMIIYFSPNLFILTNITGSMIIWISNLFTDKKGKNKDLIFEGIGYLLILLSAIIYNEIIILNFFGLNINTKKNINERRQMEEEDLINNEMPDKGINYVEIDGYYYDIEQDKDNNFKEE